MEKSERERNRRRFYQWTGAVLAVLLAGFSLWRLFVPVSGYSEVENRNLQTRPAVSLSRIASGRYARQYESYVEDQFPLRTQWLQMKSLLERLLGRTESNGIFLAGEGYLIQDFTPPAPERYDAQIAALRAFSTAHGDLRQYLLIAPTAVEIYRDKLPLLADPGNQASYLDQLAADAAELGITFVDVREAFRAAEGTQLYYKTDHHWTTDAAYLAYRQFAAGAGLGETEVSYDRLAVTDGFSGTMAASSGFRMAERERVYVYLPAEGGVDYTVSYVSEARLSPSFYQTEQLEGRDKYAVFLGGNHPLVKISTSAGSGRVLLLLKDSYANCFVPFLAEHYDRVLMVDPRYYYDGLEELISSEGVTDVLFLYNANGFASDTALPTVLGRK